MQCPKCKTEIANHLNVCWFCDSNLITLENFLTEKNKILVIIGVFGALSIYLAQTAAISNNNFLLQFGSGMSLLIVIILAFIIMSDCFAYIQKFPKNASLQNPSYGTWIKSTTEYLFLWAFLLGLFCIVISMFAFMVLYSNLNWFILYLVVGFGLLFISLSLIILPADTYVRNGKLWTQLCIIFLFSFGAKTWILYLIRDSTDITSMTFFGDLVFCCIFLFGLLNTIFVIIQMIREKQNKNPEVEFMEFLKTNFR